MLFLRAGITWKMPALTNATSVLGFRGHPTPGGSPHTPIMRLHAGRAYLFAPLAVLILGKWRSPSSAIASPVRLGSGLIRLDQRAMQRLKADLNVEPGAE